jgi:formylglycine-generating enzyme required for sulfatase activity
MPEAASLAEPRQTSGLRVFLSYSRKDGEFTRRLADALAECGYRPDFDQASYDHNYVDSGISAEDEWWRRLQTMIAAAEAVVFVVSPDSAASKVCDEEIACARALGKRVIPVLRRPIDFQKAPPRLSALNVKIAFVDDAPSTFEDSLSALRAALDVDVAWHRENRRLTALAVHWDQKGRPDDLLLARDDVRAVGNLLERRTRSSPEPAPILIELRDRSRERLDRDSRFRRQMQAATSVSLVTIIFGLIGWINQDYIKERINWFATMRPYKLRNFDPYVLATDVERRLRPGDVFLECAENCPVMSVIPPGEFVMGATEKEPSPVKNEFPRHKVKIARPFALSAYTVTFDEWEACVAVGGCRVVTDSGFGRARRPVTSVTWDDAQTYVAWLSKMTGQQYRLPTEAEWEYAARAGTSTTYYWGDQLGLQNANCVKCGTEWDNIKTAPVGAFAPNPFGLFDMVGNVWQWLEDCLHPDYNGAPEDGSAWITGDCNLRTDRGGSWVSNITNVRIAFRGSYPSENRNYSLGIRVARTLGP